MTFKQFIEFIRTYESDTFSASSEGISMVETKAIAETLIQRLVDFNLDGIMIQSALDHIRDYKKPY